MVTERWTPSGLRRWRPSTLAEDMERFMEASMAGWPFHMGWRRLPAEEMAWAPAVEIYEKQDSFIVRAELPGVKKDEIDISVIGDTLSIKGERKPPAGVKEEEYRCCEVCYGNFSRSIAMPAAVDADKIEASYEDGIVEVRLPRAKAVKPGRIEIKAK